MNETKYLKLDEVVSTKNTHFTSKQFPDRIMLQKGDIDCLSRSCDINLL